MVFVVVVVVVFVLMVIIASVSFLTVKRTVSHEPMCLTWESMMPSVAGGGELYVGYTNP